MRRPGAAYPGRVEQGAETRRDGRAPLPREKFEMKPHGRAN